ncbi:Ubiquitin modifier-activating enzyme 6 [Fasciola gigantica]|uniref:Ubiquitin modifier-activating enzyme 6 n=1 Tax=Fasciola gigantica TaxID=46835 RepID=A0A504YEL6_FASGI|nr:Ubiquitin modifier-activating enzyme 6 [Fasciola gigantica]
MVGCGAIGCELLKNLALLGVATSDHMDQVSTVDQSSPSIIPKPVSQLTSENKQSEMNDLTCSSSSNSVNSTHQDQPTTQTENTSVVVLHRTQPTATGDVASDEFVPFTSSDSGGSGATSRTHETTTLCSAPIRPSRTDDHDDGRNGTTPLDASNSAGTPPIQLTPSEHSEMRTSNTNQQSTQTVRLEFPCASEKTVRESPSSQVSSVSEQKIPRLASDEMSSNGSEALFSTATESNYPASTRLYSARSTPSIDPGGVGVTESSETRLSSVQQCVPTAHLIITDPDHIEKSNLNRQFLFRPEHIAGADGPTLLIQLASHLLGMSPSSETLSDTQSIESDRLTSQTNWLRNQLTRSLARFLASRPVDWTGCVRLGRDKFERYFNHKAARLLHAFPPGTKLADGTPFWQLPKRQPTPLVFNPANPL